MQLSLRPYVTTGVALVGASVLVAAPISPTPPDVKIAMPAESVALAQSSAEVELASVITDLLGAFNELSVAVGQGIGGGYAVHLLRPPTSLRPMASRDGSASSQLSLWPACKRRLRTRSNIPGLASYNIYALLARRRAVPAAGN